MVMKYKYFNFPVDLESLTTEEAQKSLERIFSKLLSRQPRDSRGEDLQEITTALAFELPADGRSEPTTTTTISLISTVVVLDVAQNCFTLEGDLADNGENVKMSLKSFNIFVLKILLLQ